MSYEGDFYVHLFLAFSSGLRGGKDYEKDTFRVEQLTVPAEFAHLIKPN